MQSYKQYPITIVPRAITEAKRSIIPIDVKPQKPVRPEPPQKRYVGILLTIISLIIIGVAYWCSDFLTLIWLRTVLVVIFAGSVILAIINCISNRLNNLAHRSEQEKYEYLMREYTNEMQLVDEINRKNNDRVALSQYRSQKVKETLLLTNCSLKPIQNGTTTINDEFYKLLCDYFPGKVLINYTITHDDKTTPYVSNYIVSVSDKKLYIDIEIDTPYNLETREPDAYIHNDLFSKENHNLFFEQQGWVVIRFAEEQTIKYPCSCCKYIAQIIYEIIEDDSVLQNFNTIEPIENINVWTLDQCTQLEQQHYRESYLNNNDNTMPSNDEEHIIENEEPIIEDEEPIIEDEEHNEEERQIKILPIYMNTLDENQPIPDPELEPEPEPEPEPVQAEPEPVNEPIFQPEELVFADARSEEKKNFVELVAKMNECHNLEKWDFLLDFCNKVIAIDPNFQLAYLRRSSAYGNLGQLDNAIADCETVIKLNPENPDAYYNAAVANLMLKRYNIAINYFEKAIEHKIQHPDEVYLTLAGLYKKIDDETNYNEYLQQSAALGNNTARVMIIKQKQNDGKNAGTQFQGFNTRNIKIAHEGVSDICFSFNDEYMAVSDQSRKLRVFNTTTWDAVYKQDVSATALAFSRNNKYMAVGGQSFLRVLSITNGRFELFSDIVNYTGNIKKMFFHPFNNETLFVSDNFSLYKVDIRTKVINKAINDFHLMSVSRDMQYAAGCDYFNAVKIYRINALSEIFKLNVGKTQDIKAMSINSDATRLIFGNKDGEVYVYNPQIPTEVAEKNTFSEISDIKIGSTSTFFTVLCSDRRLRFYNASTATEGREISMKYYPKLITMSNANNMLVIGNFNEDIDIVYVNENVADIPADATQRTA